MSTPRAGGAPQADQRVPRQQGMGEAAGNPGWAAWPRVQACVHTCARVCAPRSVSDTCRQSFATSAEPVTARRSPRATQLHQWVMPGHPGADGGHAGEVTDTGQDEPMVLPEVPPRLQPSASSQPPTLGSWCRGSGWLRPPQVRGEGTPSLGREMGSSHPLATR